VIRPVLFWRQAADLPALGVFGVGAKLDTGSRGTVVHATDLVTEGGQVRFTLHAAEGPVRCAAPLADMRRVTSSNGAAELRPFIRTPLSLAGLAPLEVEVSLSAREGMRFPMLVGRAALAGWGALVDSGGDG
jgi:hypothetical protein